MLKMEHLTKKYGDKTAVDDLNLHIQQGEIYGFIGHNGAGKTTTLKSVVGILQFDEGEIYVGGESVKEQPLKCKSKIAYQRFVYECTGKCFITRMDNYVILQFPCNGSFHTDKSECRC